MDSSQAVKHCAHWCSLLVGISAKGHATLHYSSLVTIASSLSLLNCFAWFTLRPGQASICCSRPATLRQTFVALPRHLHMWQCHDRSKTWLAGPAFGNLKEILWQTKMYLDVAKGMGWGRSNAIWKMLAVNLNTSRKHGEYWRMQIDATSTPALTKNPSPRWIRAKEARPRAAMANINHIHHAFFRDACSWVTKAWISLPSKTERLTNE